MLRLRQLQISLRAALQSAASQAAAEQSRADGLVAELEAERALNRHYVQEVCTPLCNLRSPLPLTLVIMYLITAPAMDPFFWSRMIFQVQRYSGIAAVTEELSRDQSLVTKVGSDGAVCLYREN